MKHLFVLICALCGFAVTTAYYPDLKPIVLNPAYDHVKYATQPRDIFRERASFDGDDDNDNNGQSDKLAIPEWVAYEIK